MVITAEVPIKYIGLVGFEIFSFLDVKYIWPWSVGRGLKVCRCFFSFLGKL
jgi:hypothetical protein